MTFPHPIGWPCNLLIKKTMFVTHTSAHSEFSYFVWLRKDKSERLSKNSFKSSLFLMRIGIAVFSRYFDKGGNSEVRHTFYLVISAPRRSLFSARWEALFSILPPWTLSSNSLRKIKSFLLREKSLPLSHCQLNDSQTNFIMLIWLWRRVTTGFWGFVDKFKRRKKTISHTIITSKR